MKGKQKEIWKEISGFEGFYEVSTHGRVRSIDRTITDSNGKKFNKKGMVLVLTSNKGKDDDDDKGYLYIYLHKDGKRKRYYVHRLVAETFIPNPENKPEVDHINTNRHDNRACNLRWTTKSENMNNEITKQRSTVTSINNLKKAHEMNKQTGYAAQKETARTILRKINKANEYKQSKENINIAREYVKKKVRCKETGTIYNSIKEAADAVGLKASTNITKACKDGNAAGRLPDGTLCHWEYYTEE